MRTENQLSIALVVGTRELVRTGKSTAEAHPVLCRECREGLPRLWLCGGTQVPC